MRKTIIIIWISGGIFINKFMSSILYYSNYCEKSKELLTKIAKSNKKEGIHFVCIDKRTQSENNQTYAVLERGNTVLIPPMVDRVPALLLLTNNNEIFFGNQINDKLELDFGAKILDKYENNMILYGNPVGMPQNYANIGTRVILITREPGNTGKPVMLIQF